MNFYKISSRIANFTIGITIVLCVTTWLSSEEQNVPYESDSEFTQSEQSNHFLKYVQQLEDSIPELSGLASQWDLLEGPDLFLEIVPKLRTFFGYKGDDRFASILERVQELPWKSRVNLFKDDLVEFSKAFVWHAFLVHKTQSIADLQRSLDAQTPPNEPGYEVIEIFTSCMDKAEQVQANQTVQSINLLEREMSRFERRYTKYVASNIELDLSGDMIFDLVKVRLNITEDLMDVDKKFRDDWRECRMKFREKYDPIVKELLKQYLEDYEGEHRELLEQQIEEYLGDLAET